MLPGGSRLAVPALAPVGAVPAAADLGEQEVGGVSREVGIPVGVSIKLVTFAMMSTLREGEAGVTQMQT